MKRKIYKVLVSLIAAIAVAAGIVGIVLLCATNNGVLVLWAVTVIGFALWILTKIMALVIFNEELED